MYLLFPCNISLANLNYLFFGQLGSAMLFSAASHVWPSSTAAFGYTIITVVLWCTFKQVLWIYAADYHNCAGPTTVYHAHYAERKLCGLRAVLHLDLGDL